MTPKALHFCKAAFLLLLKSSKTIIMIGTSTFPFCKQILSQLHFTFSSFGIILNTKSLHMQWYLGSMKWNWEPIPFETSKEHCTGIAQDFLEPLAVLSFVIYWSCCKTLYMLHWCTEYLAGNILIISTATVFFGFDFPFQAFDSPGLLDLLDCMKTKKSA